MAEQLNNMPLATREMPSNVQEALSVRNTLTEHRVSKFFSGTTIRLAYAAGNPNKLVPGGDSNK